MRAVDFVSVYLWLHQRGDERETWGWGRTENGEGGVWRELIFSATRLQWNYRPRLTWAWSISFLVAFTSAFMLTPTTLYQTWTYGTRCPYKHSRRSTTSESSGFCCPPGTGCFYSQCRLGVAFHTLLTNKRAAKQTHMLVLALLAAGWCFRQQQQHCRLTEKLFGRRQTFKKHQKAQVTGCRTHSDKANLSYHLTFSKHNVIRHHIWLWTDKRTGYNSNAQVLGVFYFWLRH